MNYAEINAQVVSLTSHPEMANVEIQSAIQAATLRMHQADYFVQDLEEAEIVLPTKDFYFQFDVYASLSRFRALKWLRLWDPTGRDPLSQQLTGAPGVFFKILSPDDVLDGYAIHKPNVCYIAGRNLNLRSDTATQFLLASWYQNPIVSPIANYKSWIADQVPFAIIFDAASIIFQTLNFQEQSRKYDALVAEQLHMVQMIGLNAKGY